jgi:hypothetical protein
LVGSIPTVGANLKLKVMDKFLLLCALFIIIMACCLFVKQEYIMALCSFVLALVILEKLSRDGKQIK